MSRRSGRNSLAARPGIHPGYKWGDGTKVLALYLRDVVLFSRYFSDADVERIVPWLYCPIDGIVLDRLRQLGKRPGASRIREIGTAEHYWRLQDRLGSVADCIGVPRVWFDDIWGDRISVAAVRQRGGSPSPGRSAHHHLFEKACPKRARPATRVRFAPDSETAVVSVGQRGVERLRVRIVAGSLPTWRATS